MASEPNIQDQTRGTQRPTYAKRRSPALSVAPGWARETFENMKNSLKQRAIAVVHALTDAAIRTGEMTCDDERYMRDLDEAKVDAVLAVCGRRSRSAKLVKAVLKSQRTAHSKPLLIGSPNGTDQPRG